MVISPYFYLFSDTHYFSRCRLIQLLKTISQAKISGLYESAI